MCQDKSLTNRMLRTVGVPVPDGRAVASADEAWAAAQEIGLPVVVKPEDGNQGKGVSVNLHERGRGARRLRRSRATISRRRRAGRALHRAATTTGCWWSTASWSPRPGATRPRSSAMAEHTVAELVEIVNQDPRRRPGHSSTLTRIVIDDAADAGAGAAGADA